MYDSTVGRWIAEDPIEFDAGDSSLIRYGANNPASNTDPNGLKISVVAGTAAPPAQGPLVGQADIDLFWDWIEELKFHGNADVKAAIADIENSPVVFTFVIERNTPTLGGAHNTWFPTRAIDIADIEKFPTEGPITQTSTIFHELMEEWYKNELKTGKFRPCHEKAQDAETWVTGFTAAGEPRRHPGPPRTITQVYLCEDKRVEVIITYDPPPNDLRLHVWQGNIVDVSIGKVTPIRRE